MEIHHPLPPHHLPSISTLSSPRFTPIAIAPKPQTTPTHTLPLSSRPTATTMPQTPSRELWTEPEKYDLLWSIILSTGLTASTIPWHKVGPLPGTHTLASAQVVVQDIALGKHHITHPTFTPSNRAGVVMLASRDLGNRKIEPVARGSSKKRKLDDSDHKRDIEMIVEKEEKHEAKTITVASREIEDTRHHNHTYSSPSSSLSPPNSSISSPSSPTSPPDHHQPPTTTTTTTTTAPATKPKPRRRRRSTSPPINLDLSNPRITSYLKSSGYMNEDGTPVKKRRGRPTKDPFGLSVTLKKQLMRMDPNAPPMKKRGRPRKRFLDIDGYRSGNGIGGEDGSISPGLRLAIEKIGEEMVEELLIEGRNMRDSDDDEDDESEDYDGEVTEGDDTDNEDDGTTAEKGVDNKRLENLVLDEKHKGLSTARKEESLHTRHAEKMAVDNLVS
ncbi:hypothetical protein TWF481_002206 [Arthrobotrys musiformis]|uniref:Uncharacterized protein n=1 Tax=Arthrobotrys musiformis TaxID=47236 RepID=A0AAV9VSH7_9PEZI